MHGEIESPLMSPDARIETDFLLRKLQNGELLSIPQSKPMPSVGAKCYELRITDKNTIWRIVYRIESDAIVINQPRKTKAVGKERF